MTEIPKCPTCGRRPSEASETVRSRAANVTTRCPDTCHALADLGPAAVALLREAKGAMGYKCFEDVHARIDALLAAAPEVKP